MALTVRTYASKETYKYDKRTLHEATPVVGDQAACTLAFALFALFWFYCVSMYHSRYIRLVSPSILLPCLITKKRLFA